MTDTPRNPALEKRIDAYLRGELNESEIENLWVDLMQQPEYLPLLETEVDLRRMLNASSKKKSWLKESWKWMAAAAVIIIMIVVGTQVQVTEVHHLMHAPVGKINEVRQLTSAPVKRSGSIRLSPVDSLMNLSYRAAIAGKKAEAISGWEKIITQYSGSHQVGDAYLNVGILNYNAGKYKLAAQNFGQAISQGNLPAEKKEQAGWFKGNALINLHQWKQARETLIKVYEMNGGYQKKAYQLVRKLDYRLGNMKINP